MASLNSNAITRGINNRAYGLLAHHMSMLGAAADRFEKKDEAYYLEDAATDSYLRIGYVAKSKMLTKTFNLEFKYVINGVDLYPESFKARLKFRGSKEIELAFFEPDKRNDEVKQLLNDQKFLQKIVKHAREVDINAAVLEYNKSGEVLTVRITPYAGAYMWVKIPPVFYPLKLRENEMKSLLGLAKDIGKYYGIK